jgi:uncharacterized membrane protein (DUF2068 family)
MVSKIAPSGGHMAVRSVALFEGIKGLIVLTTGFGVLTLVHRDVQSVAEHVVRHLHMNPASHLPSIFIELAGRITDGKLWALAAGAMGYSTLRLVEAYGLWLDRTWASWLAVVSGGIYLPIEIYELVKKPSVIHAVVFAGNLLIVTYLVVHIGRRRR